MFATRVLVTGAGGLRDPQNRCAVAEEVDEIYHLAADMGGIGFVSFQRATTARDNTR